ncbi:hypothetical protein KFL_003890040 [Klebsormidium nitens]|uniref:Uncharacterized protein n=1 Tax=Klebsormidium nitens TaxID=105231 RepID=A0A1Y1IBJ0_KLENI|nr:hypothetical protein KFL_003890040 [Klebsormidium nitens]|eukprot:GAQ87933.1 hypothetical protein KFL_003890040 [Klebsormidium nitens]
MDRHVHIRCSFNPDHWVPPDSKHYSRFRNITRAALGLERLTVNSHGLFEALRDAFGAKQTDMDKYLNQKVSVIRDLFPKQLASTSPYLSDFDTKTYFNQFQVDPAQLKRAMLKVAGEGGPEVVINGDEFLSRLLQVVELDAERLDHVAYNFIIDLFAKASKGTKTDTIFQIEEDAGMLSVFGDGEWTALDDEFPRGVTWAFLKDPERCQLPTLEPPPLPPFQPEAPPPPPELPPQPRVPPVRLRPPQPQPSSVDKPITRTSPRRTSRPSDSDSDSDSNEEDSDESDDDGPQGGAHGERGKQGASEDVEAAGESGEQSDEGSESEGGGADNGGSESSSGGRPVTPSTPPTPACNEQIVRNVLAPRNLKLEELEDQDKLYRKKNFTKRDAMLATRDLARAVLGGRVAVNAVNGGAEAGVGRAPQREADAGGSATVTSILGVVTAQQATLLKIIDKQQEDAREERAGLVTTMMTNVRAMSQKQTDGMQAFARSLMQSTARHPAFRIEEQPARSTDSSRSDKKRKDPGSRFEEIGKRKTSSRQSR